MRSWPLWNSEHLTSALSSLPSLVQTALRAVCLGVEVASSGFFLSLGTDQLSPSSVQGQCWVLWGEEGAPPGSSLQGQLTQP